MKKLLIALSALAFLLPTTVSAQLNVPQGGTGSTTLSGILYGIPGNLRVQTVNIGAGCTFLTGNLSCAGILSTTTALVAGQSVYATGLNTIGSVATSSLIAGTGVTFSGTPGYLIGGTNLTINASGSGTVNSGLAGDHAYYAANGTAVSATSTIFLSTAMNVGIQTATPAFPLDVTAPGTTGETVRIYSGVLPNINSAVNLAGGLTVIADGTTTNTSAFEGYSGTTGQGDGADNVFFSSRGVPGTPTDLSKNDSLGLLDFRGQYTTGVSGARARFEANAAEAWSSSTNNGTYFDWQVTPAGSATIADVMRLQSSGGLVLGNSYLTTDPGAGSEILSGNLGIGTTTPGALLGVNGSGYFAGFLGVDQYSGFKQAGNTILYASTTNTSLAVGASGAVGNWIAATSSLFYDIAIGQGALATAPTSGVAQFNVGIGYNALTDITTGANNFGLGFETAQDDTTGGNNVGIGLEALQSNQSGVDNVALGSLSLQNNTTNNNVGVGYETLARDTIGNSNTAIGTESFLSETNGSSNVGIGAFTGLIASSTEADNTYIGFSAGEYASSTTSVSLNTFIGYDAGAGLINSYLTGKNNTLIGAEQGLNLTTGTANTLIGTCDTTACNSQVTTGAQNIAIGYDNPVPVAGNSGQLDIGNIIYGAGNTNTGFTYSTGQIGIGSTTPGARFAIQANAGDTNPYLFMIGSSTASATTTLYKIDNVGHQTTSGGTPGISGGTSSVSGNDNNGTITVTGTALTSVTLTFAQPWATAPDCTESDNSTALTADITSISTTQVVFGFSIGVSSGIVWYQCRAHS